MIITDQKVGMDNQKQSPATTQTPTFTYSATDINTKINEILPTDCVITSAYAYFRGAKSWSFHGKANITFTMGTYSKTGTNVISNDGNDTFTDDDIEVETDDLKDYIDSNGRFSNNVTLKCEKGAAGGTYWQVSLRFVFSYITKDTITASSNPAGAGAISGAGDYYTNDQATLTAIPADGYKFTEWDDGTTDNPKIITVTSNATYIANFSPISYKISYDANGGTGSMADTVTTFGTATVLRPNSFSSPKYNVNLSVNGGNLNQTNYSLDRTFLGWKDTGSITAYNGEEFTYLQFDAPYYANADINVYEWAGGYHKYNLIYHYVAAGRDEGRNPIDPNGEPGYYPNQATVTSLTTNEGYKVPLLAGWGSAQLILPTPTRKYHEFLGWDDGISIYPAGYNLEINSNNVTLTARWKKNHYRAFVGIDDLQDIYARKNKKISRIFLGTDEI